MVVLGIYIYLLFYFIFGRGGGGGGVVFLIVFLSFRVVVLFCFVVFWGGVVVVCDGWGTEQYTCPYPLKVQARPPRDQRLATQSRVSGRKGKKGAIVILNQLRSMFVMICIFILYILRLGGFHVSFAGIFFIC